MRQIRLESATALAMLVIGCNPIVSTHTKAEGINISSEYIAEGKEAFVKIRIISAEEGARWNVEFVGSTPENLSVDVNASITNIRWKLGKDHIKALGIAPYELKLSSGDKVFKANVVFRTTSEQIIGAFIQSVIRIH